MNKIDLKSVASTVLTLIFLFAIESAFASVVGLPREWWHFVLWFILGVLLAYPCMFLAEALVNFALKKRGD